jgi:hypothetical protein
VRQDEVRLGEARQGEGEVKARQVEVRLGKAKVGEAK